MPDKVTVYTSALKEIYRRDFERYAREQLWIRGAEPGAVLRLVFKPIQQHIWMLEKQQLEKKGYIRAYVVKPRQPGSSTLAQACMFWKASLTKNFSCLLIALDDDNTSNIFNMSRFFYENLDPMLKPAFRYSSKKELVFDADKRKNPNAVGLGSSMQFQNSTRMQAGTGTTRHGVHISEAAKFNPNATTFLEHSLMPAIHLLPGTIIINESTTFVNGDWFRAGCEKARDGRSEFILIFVPWWFEPEYSLPLEPGQKLKLDKEERYIVDLAKRGQPDYSVPPFELTLEQLNWRRLIISSRTDGERLFNQEYPMTYESAWINMDLNVFDHVAMRDIEKTIEPPKILGNIFPGPKVLSGGAHFSPEEDYFAVWREPDKQYRYDIGVDTAVGIDGGDWSTAIVWNRMTHEQVAELHCHDDVFDFAERLYWLGYYYHIAQLAVEVNNVGAAVHGALASRGYPYLYRWRYRERDVPTISKLGGWKTQRDSKAYLVALFRDAVNKRRITIHSRLLLEEMRDFVTIPGFDYGGDSYRAQRGHDDLVMAAGIGLVASDDESYGLKRTEHIANALNTEEAVAQALAKGPWNHDSKLPRRDGLDDPVDKLSNTLKGWKLK